MSRPSMHRFPCWIFVKTRDQLGYGRFACAGVPYQGKSLSGLYEQVEVTQDRFLIRITEIEIFKFDLAFESRYILLFLLNHIRVRVDQCKDTFCGGKPPWICAQKEVRFKNGEEELVEAHDKEIPRANGHQALRHAHAAHVDQYANENTRERIERGEYKR